MPYFRSVISINLGCIFIVTTKIYSYQIWHVYRKGLSDMLTFTSDFPLNIFLIVSFLIDQS
jgi:hypothetical protein